MLFAVSRDVSLCTHLRPVRCSVCPSCLQTKNHISNVFSQFSSVRLLSRIQLFATLWIAAHQASLSITNSQSLLKLRSIEPVMPSNYLILFCPLLFLPQPLPASESFPMSQLFASGGQSIRASALASALVPSSEHPGLISFGMDCMDILAIQGTLRSLLQLHSSIASILRCSAFFIVQLSYPYMTTGKTIALTRWTFVD